jgi:hypothetical protein
MLEKHSIKEKLGLDAEVVQFPQQNFETVKQGKTAFLLSIDRGDIEA